MFTEQRAQTLAAAGVLFIFVFLLVFGLFSFVEFILFSVVSLVCKHAILERVRHAHMRCSMCDCECIVWMRVILMWTGTSSKTNQCVATLQIMKECNKTNEMRRSRERERCEQKEDKFCPPHVATFWNRENVYRKQKQADNS